MNGRVKFLMEGGSTGSGSLAFRQYKNVYAEHDRRVLPSIYANLTVKKICTCRKLWYYLCTNVLLLHSGFYLIGLTDNSNFHLIDLMEKSVDNYKLLVSYDNYK